MRFASEMSLNRTDFDFRAKDVSDPPSLRIVSPPCASTAVSTATRCGQRDGLDAVTVTVGAPNCSSVRFKGVRNVRMIFPRACILAGPLETAVKRLTLGGAEKL